MKEILQAFFLGIIQGITEFLPISSSGHMSLFRHFTGMDTESAGLFSAMLHIGTLVAILIVFYKPVYELFLEFIACIKDIVHKRFSFKLKDMSPTRRMLMMFVLSCVPLLLLLLPVGKDKNLMDAVGVFASDNSIKAEGLCFMITGFMLLVGSITNENTNRFRKISPPSAVLIGVAQLFAACFPGISRSGATIFAGLSCRMSIKSAVKYSFILSIPAVIASALVEVKDAVNADVSVSVPALLVGVVTASVVGVFSIKLLNKLMEKNLFKYFGYYCVVLGFIVTVIGAVEAFVK